MTTAIVGSQNIVTWRLAIKAHLPPQIVNFFYFYSRCLLDFIALFYRILDVNKMRCYFAS